MRVRNLHGQPLSGAGSSDRGVGPVLVEPLVPSGALDASTCAAPGSRSPGQQGHDGGTGGGGYEMSAGYAAVYQALVIVLAGVVIYAITTGRRAAGSQEAPARLAGPASRA